MARARPVPLPAKRPADPVGRYAYDVVKGKTIACRWVKLTCERHFRDLADGARRGLMFSPEWAAYAIGFFPRYLRHSKGEWGGQPMVLSPWEAFVVGSAFGWFRRDGTRRYRTVYVEVARKNGKSTLAAGIGLYGLVPDNEPGAEVYAAATRRDQARIIFGEAQRMVRASPDLRRVIASFKLNLSVDATASKFEPLSADDRTLDGLNPHMVLVDELHKHRTRAVLDVLDTALGARRSPMVWVITTAGDDNPESVYAAENAYACQVAEGVIADDSYLPYVATLDDGDRWDDPKVWQKANPNLGISVKMDDLRRQALKASRSPPSLTAFKRLRLNVRTSDATRFLSMDTWRRNTAGPFDPATLQGRQFYGGLDLSSRVDLSAWVKLYPPQGDETRWWIVPRFWVPSDTVIEKSLRDRVQYQRWIDEGLVEATEGNVVDQNEIQHAMIEDCRLSECLSCAFDPWNSAMIAVNLGDAGVPMVEFVQGIRSFTAPTKQLEVLALADQLEHGANEVLAWMCANLHIRRDANDNYAPTKLKSLGRIDGMVALIMAVGRSMATEGESYLNESEPISF